MMFLEVDARRIDSMESGFSSEETSPAPAPAFVPKRLFAVGAGLLGLAGAAIGALHLSAPSQAAVQPDHVTARGLLEHPDFIDVAAQNIQTLAGDHLKGKEHELKPAMHRMMRKLTDILSENDPEGTKQLESIRLSPDQKADVLSMVKQMGDRRVQSVGKEVLEIALKHKDDEKGDFESIQNDLSSKFQPRMEELKTLKTSIVPASLRELEDKFNVDSSAEGRRLEGVSTKEPGSTLTAADSKAANMKLEDALGVVGGLLEQARLALDESAVIGGSFGSTHHVPYFWRSLIGLAAFGTETADCFMRQNDVKDAKGEIVNADSTQTNSVKMAMCPMKYAGAGMDFLSGANNVMNLQNTRLPQDFGMLFGGAAPHAAQPGYSPYAQQQHYNAFARQQTQHPMLGNMFGHQQIAQSRVQHPMMQMANGHPMMQMANGVMHSLAQHATNQYPNQYAHGYNAHATALQHHPGFTYTR